MPSSFLGIRVCISIEIHPAFDVNLISFGEIAFAEEITSRELNNLFLHIYTKKDILLIDTKCLHLSNGARGGIRTPMELPERF